MSSILISFTVNHSCEPNVAFDLSSSDASEWHVRALKPIEEGDKREFASDREGSCIIGNYSDVLLPEHGMGYGTGV
jgi:hypothetical protein